MDRFPFSKKEWRSIREAARSVAEAAQSNDADRRAARFTELLTLLKGLRDRHGDHPALLETEADFTPDPPAAVAIYRQAGETAAMHGLPTLSIRMSLARLLLEELADAPGARSTLLAGRAELVDARSAECSAWAALLVECDNRLPAAVEPAVAAVEPTPTP
jgi:hypothetical protein